MGRVDIARQCCWSEEANENACFEVSKKTKQYLHRKDLKRGLYKRLRSRNWRESTNGVVVATQLAMMEYCLPDYIAEAVPSIRTSDGLGILFSQGGVPWRRSCERHGILQSLIPLVSIGELARPGCRYRVAERLSRCCNCPGPDGCCFEEFQFTHGQVGQKVGKSREYVSNTLRLLSLPQEVLDALSARKITEGHTRPIMMLADKPEEQMVLFKEIIFKKMNVRDAEKYARRIAVDRVRNKEYILDPELLEMEEHLAEALGTRVHVEKSQNGGQITIDFFTNEDLRNILEVMKSVESKGKKPTDMLDRHIAAVGGLETMIPSTSNPSNIVVSDIEAEQIEMLDDRDEKEKQIVEEELYNIKNFSL